MQELFTAGLQGPFFMGVILSVALVTLARFGRLITVPAAGGVGVVSLATFAFAGWGLWLVLLWFLANSLVASRFMVRSTPGNFGRADKESIDLLSSTYAPVGMVPGPYRLGQVISATLPFMACCFAYALSGEQILLVVAVGALAASAADTWASEVGIYSEKEPVDIMSGKPVQRGLSGGVSSLGLSATVVSSTLIGLLALAFLGVFNPALSAGGLELLLIVGCGVVGSVSDSLFGSAFQAKYERERGFEGRPSSMLVEVAPASDGAVLVSGYAWVSNDVVNLASGIVATAFGLAIVGVLVVM